MRFTEIEQPALAAMFPPVRLIEVDPATAVVVPPQVLLNPLGVATTTPVGNVTVNATPVKATVFAAGLLMPMNSSDPCVLGGTSEGLISTFATTGGATTVIVAEAVLPVPPSVEVTWLVV